MGDNMMAMADVQRKSWQTKACTAHIALSYDDMDTSQKIHNLNTSNVNSNHGIQKFRLEYINDIKLIKNGKLT